MVIGLLSARGKIIVRQVYSDDLIFILFTKLHLM